MPCNTTQVSTVEIGKLNPELLVAALAAMKLAPRQSGAVIYFGNRESYNTETGKMQMAWNRSANEIKRAYSAEVVKSQAKKFGWQLTETGPYQYQVTRR